jgi:hypothetical protein
MRAPFLGFFVAVLKKLKKLGIELATQLTWRAICLHRKKRAKVTSNI